MKHFTFFLICILAIPSIAQIPEIAEVKKNMSLGEKLSYKIILPNQETSKAEKITKEILQSLNAAQVKSAKGSNELIYSKLYFKGNDKPVRMYVVVEQEGKNTGWTGYFVNEKDSQNVESTLEIKALMISIYNKSMFLLYEDSINFQQKSVKAAQGNLKGKSKTTEKNQKYINSSKAEITESEAAIEKSKSTVASVSSTLADLTTKQTDAKSKLKSAEDEIKKVELVEKEIKESLSKYKKMTKNLAELQKDPATNANLIAAGITDLENLAQSIASRQSEYGSMLSDAKTNVKMSEKETSNARDNVKNAAKLIKIETNNISKQKNNIDKNKKTIERNQKQIDVFLSFDKSSSEDQIKIEEKKLEELKSLQNPFN